MIIKEMEPLAPYTTFKMGGLARKMYFPEAKEELISLLNENENLANFLLGGGFESYN